MDPVSDLLIRIKNAQGAGRESLELPYSKIKFNIAKILEREGFLAGVERKGPKAKERLQLNLKYVQGAPTIQDLRRVSKIGQRIYTSAHKIKRVKQGYGLAIISTSQGLMTDKEAKQKKLGGEILCEIW
jgi:small subunit ribosomal protein S8